ncbi:MAG: metal ABC transporter ATP-binding protein [Clostridia bacterium]|nr:metal ABC transporter ATP-binding protein [Clostridia bacterium]
MALITCDNVSFAYEGRTVLKDLSLTIERGEYLCIVGENGSGKSTLIKGLLGLLNPSAGKITYEKGFLNTAIGYLPQKTEAQKDFPASVWEVVSSGCHDLRLFTTKKQQEKIHAQMELLGITGLKKRSFADLSGGQQQRVLLARALCATQTMLLLDEPVAGLDPLVTREMYQIISMLHREQNLTVVMISHDIQAALHHGDRILHLSHGESYLGTVEEYLKSPLGMRFAGGDDHV